MLATTTISPPPPRRAWPITLLVILAAWLLEARPAYAGGTVIDSGSSERDELQEAYRRQLQNNPSPFGSIPVTHVIPARGTITGAVAVDYYDARIVPEGTDISESRLGQAHLLDVKGWTAAPLVAYSWKNLALGGTVEAGRRESHYLFDGSKVKPNPTSSIYLEQTGRMRYSGAGAYVYLLPDVSLLPRAVQATVMAGTVRLKATYENSGTITSADSGTYRAWTYDVTRTQIGTNVAIQIGKQFSVIVWYNYVAHKLGDADPQFTAVPQEYQKNVSHNELLEADRELYWLSQPRQRLGLDIALRFKHAELHLGGLLGLVAAAGTSADNIHDNTLLMSIAFSTQDR